MPCCFNDLHLLLKEPMASCPPWVCSLFFLSRASLLPRTTSPTQRSQMHPYLTLFLYFFVYKKRCSCWTVKFVSLFTLIIIQFNQNELRKGIYPGIHPPKWLDVNFKIENLGCPRALQPCSCRSHWLNGKKKLPCLLLPWSFLKKPIR